MSAATRQQAGSRDGDEAIAALHRVGRWPLVTAREMQALDRRTIDERGVPGEILMEAAGRMLVGPALDLRRQSANPAAVVRAFCGAGNNGGDGFVAVRHLHAEGVESEAVLLGDPVRLPADAAANWKRLERAGVPRRAIAADRIAGVDWPALFAQTSVAIDALFGTGLVRPIEGDLGDWIERLEQARANGLRVLAVDLPSGIHADTGAVLGRAVRADRTVTISLPKVGLALEPGRSHAGRIEVARVGIDDPEPERLPNVELWNARYVRTRFPVRDRAGHKGRFGHVLVVAGSTGKTGAAVLATRAALRAGAGLVTLAYPSGVEAELAALAAEVMSAPVASLPEGCFARAGRKAIEELVAERDVVAIGPGIGTASETRDLVRALVGQIDRPLVVDADGLNVLAEDLTPLHERNAATILTPHPGEAARLLDATSAEINADRIGAARALASASRATVLLKGAATVVAAPSGRALVIPTGGPVLATGGTGDVLTGIVAALLAAGLAPFDTAGLAAWWHGAAADAAPPVAGRIRAPRGRAGRSAAACRPRDSRPNERLTTGRERWPIGPSVPRTLTRPGRWDGRSDVRSGRMACRSRSSVRSVPARPSS